MSDIKPGTMLDMLVDIPERKHEERQLAAAIRALEPGLEPHFAKHLADWETALAQTADSAEAWIRTVSSSDILRRRSTDVQTFVHSAAAQSEEFARQLQLMLTRSRAISNNREAASRIREWVRRSPTHAQVQNGAPDATRDGANEMRDSKPDTMQDMSPGPMRDSMPNPMWDAALGPMRDPMRDTMHDPMRDAMQETILNPMRDPSRDPWHVPMRDAMRDDTLPITGEGSWSNPHFQHVTPPASVPIGGHRLPPLPYPYDALEPYIDETTMRLHHDKHHQSYVDGLNRAEKKMLEARRKQDFELIKHWEREAAFHGAGHYLHTIFWEAMSPEGGGSPGGALGAQIKRDFGSFEAFKKHFSHAAEQVEGGGWAILVWSPRSRRLEILQAEKHQNLSQWDVVPLLPLDVWEHAYYLKYNNRRADYIDAWWNVVNWPYVAERFEQARQLQWKPW